MLFYTYLWLRENGTPYYVGKGSANRAFERHRVGPAPSVDRIIMQEWPDEALAFEGEKLLIAYFGRKDNGTGCLRNLTDGGEGAGAGNQHALGHCKSIESKTKASVRMKGTRNLLGFKFSQESRRKMSEAHRGKLLTQEHRTKIGMSNLGRKGTKSWLGRHHSEKTKAKISAINSGKATRGSGWHHSEETKQKMRAAARRREHGTL